MSSYFWEAVWAVPFRLKRMAGPKPELSGCGLRCANNGV